MKKIIKDLAWKLPIAMMWGYAADFPFNDLSFCEGTAAWMVFMFCLDAIRWGLKKD